MQECAWAAAVAPHKSSQSPRKGLEQDGRARLIAEQAAQVALQQELERALQQPVRAKVGKKRGHVCRGATQPASMG